MIKSLELAVVGSGLSSAAEKIEVAVHRVLAGHLHASEAVNGKILNKLIDGNTYGCKSGDAVVDRLSNRELEVFQFIGRGHSTRGIAQEMHISVKTVETYRAHIKEKFKLKTAPELMRFSIHWLIEQNGVSHVGAAS